MNETNMAIELKNPALRNGTEINVFDRFEWMKSQLDKFDSTHGTAYSQMIMSWILAKKGE